MLHHADAPPCLLAYGQSPRRLLSCCRTDVFDDCAAPRLLFDIVKLPLKPPPLCVKQNMVRKKHGCCISTLCYQM